MTELSRWEGEKRWKEKEERERERVVGELDELWGRKGQKKVGKLESRLRKDLQTQPKP